jgi:hypothetical protein
MGEVRAGVRFVLRPFLISRMQDSCDFAQATDYSGWRIQGN